MAERGKRRKRSPDMAFKLKVVAYVEGERSQNLPVTRGSVQLKAREIHDDDGEDDNFSASRGWLKDFFQAPYVFFTQMNRS